MPVDPRHRRRLPVGRPLAAAVRQVWTRQAADCDRWGWAAVGAVSSAWDATLAEAALPLLTRYLQSGYDAEGRRLLRLAGRTKALVGAQPRLYTKGWPDWLPSWLRGGEPAPGPRDWFSLPAPPQLWEAARSLAWQFARVVNQTTRDLVRRAVTASLHRGETPQQRSARVNRIFHDPRRALTIAQTESSRVVHAGQVLRDREEEQRTGLRLGLRWMASQGACRRCEALSGVVKPLGEPFFVDPKGGPYAVVTHAPLHANCRCVCVSTIL